VIHGKVVKWIWGYLVVVFCVSVCQGGVLGWVYCWCVVGKRFFRAFGGVFGVYTRVRVFVYDGRGEGVG